MRPFCCKTSPPQRLRNPDCGRTETCSDRRLSSRTIPKPVPHIHTIPRPSSALTRSRDRHPPFRQAIPRDRISTGPISGEQPTSRTQLSLPPPPSSPAQPHSNIKVWPGNCDRSEPRGIQQSSGRWGLVCLLPAACCYLHVPFLRRSPYMTHCILCDVVPDARVC